MTNGLLSMAVLGPFCAIRKHAAFCCITMAISCTLFSTTFAGESTANWQPPGQSPASQTSDGVQATTALLSGDATRTEFRLRMTKGVTAEVFTLANPYRIIIDLPDVSFRLPDATGTKGQGLITAFRYGQFAEGKARIVLDAARPVLIEKAGMTALPQGQGVELAIVLNPTNEQTFGSGTGAARSEQDTVAAAPAPSAPNNVKPVILIDPGHGGIDGGAVGSPNLIEKHVVLAVAKELQRQLNKTNRYDVRLTRSADVFISLDRRLKLSRDQAADLFISLHADAIADPQFMPLVRGATVYTLSERASDEQARLMAEKENASDRIAGLDTSTADSGGEVKGILIDLMKRETANFSADFSTMLTGSLKKTVRLSRDPQRSAAFKVLKQTGAPSVLLELGYLSHVEDQKLLGSTEWQRTIATSITSAIDRFFAKRNAGAVNAP